MRASAITATRVLNKQANHRVPQKGCLSRSSSDVSVQEKGAAALKALGYYPLQISGFYFAFSQLPVWGLFYFLCFAAEQLTFVLAP